MHLTSILLTTIILHKYKYIVAQVFLASTFSLQLKVKQIISSGTKKACLPCCGFPSLVSAGRESFQTCCTVCLSLSALIKGAPAVGADESVPKNWFKVLRIVSAPYKKRLLLL